MDFETIKEEFKRLPPWAWLVLAVVGFFVVRAVIGSRGVSTATPSDGSTDATLPDGTAGGFDPGGSQGTPGSSSSGGTTSSSGSKTTSGGTTSSSGSKSSSSSGTTSSKPKGTTYTVRQGDTLADIGYAHGIPWQSIYTANQAVIESTAKQHGFGSSDNGHWIFPGEQLVLPA